MSSATTGYPSTQYFSEDFVVSAGCVLFRRHDSNGGLQICVLHDRNTDEWMLPKGRKDCGESIQAAAVRETFEETGYPCVLLPVRMPTRAPAPGVNGADAVAVLEGVTEPIAVVVRDMSNVGRGIKIVWWYVARTTGEPRVLGTQTAWEAFDPEWVDVDGAAGRLTFQSDRETVARAVELVRDGKAEM
ncbi:NUDIX hydrolase domain-like protein [Mycena galopus ATCC 62051]|nr:NUDIX hydrolase domain-like protein [Mycena galopus ATCC 62051]